MQNNDHPTMSMPESPSEEEGGGTAGTVHTELWGDSALPKSRNRNPGDIWGADTI